MAMSIILGGCPHDSGLFSSSSQKGGCPPCLNGSRVVVVVHVDVSMDTGCCCSSLLMRGEDGAPLDEGGERRMARGPPMSPGPRDMREEVGVTMVGESITPRPSRYLWGEEGMLMGCKGSIQMLDVTTQL